MIRMKDCDVGEPSPVDDEWITREGVSRPPEGVECRLAAFVLLLRIMVVLESVLDVSPSRHSSQDNNSFLARVSSRHRGGAMNMMHEELALLDEIHGSVPKVWAHSQETLGCGDPIRVTQAERLHCAEMWVRMLVWRHRFAEVVASASPSAGADGGSNGVFGGGGGVFGEGDGGEGEREQGEGEIQAMGAAHHCALQIIHTHLAVATKGLMTYCTCSFSHFLCSSSLYCALPTPALPLRYPTLPSLSPSPSHPLPIPAIFPSPPLPALVFSTPISLTLN